MDSSAISSGYCSRSTYTHFATRLVIFSSPVTILIYFKSSIPLSTRCYISFLTIEFPTTSSSRLILSAFLKVVLNATYAREDAHNNRGPGAGTVLVLTTTSLSLIPCVFPFQNHWHGPTTSELNNYIYIFLVQLDHTRICPNSSQPSVYR